MHKIIPQQSATFPSEPVDKKNTANNSLSSTEDKTNKVAQRSGGLAKNAVSPRLNPLQIKPMNKLPSVAKRKREDKEDNKTTLSPDSKQDLKREYVRTKDPETTSASPTLHSTASKVSFRFSEKKKTLKPAPSVFLDEDKATSKPKKTSKKKLPFLPLFGSTSATKVADLETEPFAILNPKCSRDPNWNKSSLNAQTGRIHYNHIGTENFEEVAQLVVAASQACGNSSDPTDSLFRKALRLSSQNLIVEKGIHQLIETSPNIQGAHIRVKVPRTNRSFHVNLLRRLDSNRPYDLSLASKWMPTNITWA